MSSKIFLKGGSEYISSRIEEAQKNETRTATISGNYEINEAVRIPSNFTLILENCHLRMADGCYSNMFVNENNGTEVGKTVDGTNKNINIIGRGTAILDGGKYNGLSEKNHSKDGMPPIWKNNLLLFTNVDGFKVSGVSCINQRWWALNFIYCANGYISDIDFCASDIMIDSNGEEHHGLKRAVGYDILVKNADGIDLRKGCHDIVIENITGFTQDDTIALTALNGKMEKNFDVVGLTGDICNVVIKNVKSSSFCTNVRLLNQGELKLHDILIDGVYDTSKDSPYMDRGIYAVRIGDVHLYGTRHSTADETYNITVRNVCGRGTHVIALAGDMKNFVMYGIESNDGAKMLFDRRVK